MSRIIVRFGLEEAQTCADDFIARGVVCGGCKWYSHCGVGTRDARFLQQFVRTIDPLGANVELVPLTSLGGK